MLIFGLRVMFSSMAVYEKGMTRYDRSDNTVCICIPNWDYPSLQISTISHTCKAQTNAGFGLVIHFIYLALIVSLISLQELYSVELHELSFQGDATSVFTHQQHYSNIERGVT